MEEDKMGRACGTYWREARCIQGFGGETWRNEPLERPRRRREDNIKIDLQEVGLGDMD